MRWRRIPHHRKRGGLTPEAEEQRPFVKTKPVFYEELFPDIRAAWDNHDEHCESLRWLWAGRPGGVSDLISQTLCNDCGVMFYNEGLAWLNWDEDTVEADEIHVCACCARKRGYTVTASPRDFGIHATKEV